MRYLINTGLSNRKYRRSAIAQEKADARKARRPEVVSYATKRMDRPERINAANYGYDFIHALISRGIALQSR